MRKRNRVLPRSAARGGRPTKARAAEIDEHILATASDFFARTGFAATSVEQVALACGAGKDTIYRRFPSKRSLFTADIERARVRILARLEGIADQEHGADSLSRLRNVMRWLLDVNLDPELLAFKRIWFGEAMLQAMQSWKMPDPDPIMQRLVLLVSGAQASGHLRNADPVFLTTQLISSIITGPTTTAMLGQTPFASDTAKEIYFDQAWMLFIGGVARDVSR